MDGGEIAAEAASLQPAAAPAAKAAGDEDAAVAALLGVGDALTGALSPGFRALR
jgi:hypothetical protein